MSDSQGPHGNPHLRRRVSCSRKYSLTSPTAAKKGKSKKKKNGKANGDGPKLQKLENDSKPDVDDVDADAEVEELESPTVVRRHLSN